MKEVQLGSYEWNAGVNFFIRSLLGFIQKIFSRTVILTRYFRKIMRTFTVKFKRSALPIFIMVKILILVFYRTKKSHYIYWLVQNSSLQNVIKIRSSIIFATQRKKIKVSGKAKKRIMGSEVSAENKFSVFESELLWTLILREVLAESRNIKWVLKSFVIK